MARPGFQTGFGSSLFARPPAWFRPPTLLRLYEEAGARVHAAGPPLSVFRTIPEDSTVPAGLEEPIGILFERALRRVRTPWGEAPSIGVRIDVENGVEGGRREIVVRIYDTGPIADPPGLPSVDLSRLPGVVWKREPPAGPWTSVMALRIEWDGAPEPGSVISNLPVAGF